jgi:UTP--glucose-1-phosphate uridylyltransferase
VKRVHKAVIPAAGLGTRFLPATKAVPKEMLPVVDKPAIQYAIEEAVRVGIDDVLIITSRGKETLSDHFDRSPELEQALAAKGKDDEAAEIRALAELADIHFIRQAEPLGLGHAVGLAREHVGDDDFAVMLPDDLIHERVRLLRGMVDAQARHGGSVVALMVVPPEQVSLYGCARYDAGPEDGLVRLRAVVEKPRPEEAPSNLSVMGRYVLTPAIFDALDRVKPGAGGELQLTDAIGLLLEEEPVFGFTFAEGRYDTGNKLDYLRAVVELATERDDLGPDFRAFLTEFVSRLDR